ncbi:MAG TPA: PDZ domain-containing protein [Acidimicrobiales bacterium]|nr:PDZ domain-containing protein [Acidimicrobiales bacterium]
MIVTQVPPGRAADKAGIRVGEVITQINGQPTLTLSALQQVPAGLKPGDSATVNILNTDGGHRSVKVPLDNPKGS